MEDHKQNILKSLKDVYRDANADNVGMEDLIKKNQGIQLKTGGRQMMLIEED